MALGTAYGPRLQHCLSCLDKRGKNGIVARVTQTRRRGVCQRKQGAIRIHDLLICWWPLPQTSLSKTHALDWALRQVALMRNSDFI